MGFHNQHRCPPPPLPDNHITGHFLLILRFLWLVTFSR